MTASGDRHPSPQLELTPAKNGLQTALMGGVYLHSRFDPAREAQRYLEAHASPRADTLIIFGPGLGYLSAAARTSTTPRWSRVLCIFLQHQTYLHAVDRGDMCWFPGCGVGLDDFLRTHLSPQDIPALEVLPWASAARALEQTASAHDFVPNLEAKLVSTIEELRRELVTAAYFSERRVRNVVQNVFTNGIYALKTHRPHNGPALVVASGPTLEGVRDPLRRAASGALVVATSSAVPFLSDAGVSPDIIVHIDAGYYARLHLHRGRAHPQESEVPVAMPFTAGKVAVPLVPVVFGTVEEDLLGLTGTHQDAVELPEDATVSATACRVAQLLATGPHYCLGFDFASQDLLDHARPHAFDRYMELRARRVEPGETLRFVRIADHDAVAGAWRQSTALAHYAAWFARNADTFQNFLRVAPSPVDIGIATAEAKQMVAVCGQTPTPPSLIDHTEDVTNKTRLRLRRRLGELRDEWARYGSTPGFLSHPPLARLSEVADFAGTRRVRSGEGGVEDLRSSVSRLLHRLLSYAGS